MGDKQKIRQVLINLVSNAVKFTHTGQIDIAARLISVEAENVLVAITAKHTGIGIKKNQIGRLFGSLTQVHSTVSNEHYGGTGLGLSISKHVVELMGGDIRLAETSDKGSTFAFQIKLAF